MKNIMFSYYLVIGDWSNDGHEKSDNILITTNKTKLEIQNAYKQSCKLTNCQFHDEVCNEYQNNELSEKIINIFKAHNIPDDILNEFINNPNPDSFTKLFMWFTSLSLPDLQYEMKEDDIPTLNGWWDKNLNVTLGYGLYD